MALYVFMYDVNLSLSLVNIVFWATAILSRNLIFNFFPIVSVLSEVLVAL